MLAGKKQLNAHIWDQEEHKHYVEMRWCNRVLFAEEAFRGTIHDPCCGWGRVPEAAREAGHRGVTGSDIVHRGFEGCGVHNFLTGDGAPIDHADNYVFNPPFDNFEPFIRKAFALANPAYGKVAALLPTNRLNAAWWMRELPLVRVWFMTPRPSMPPGYALEQIMIATGKDASGDTKDYCWVVFDKRGELGDTRYGWLHREKGRI